MKSKTLWQVESILADGVVIRMSDEEGLDDAIAMLLLSAIKALDFHGS